MNYEEFCSEVIGFAKKIDEEKAMRLETLLESNASCSVVGYGSEILIQPVLDTDVRIWAETAIEDADMELSDEEVEGIKKDVVSRAKRWAEYDDGFTFDDVYETTSELLQS